MWFIKLSEPASSHKSHVVIVPLLELIRFFALEWFWLSHNFRQLVGCHYYWNVSPLLFWMSMLLFYNKSLSFKKELSIHVLVLWIKKLAQTTLLTDDKMRSLRTVLVFAVKVTPCLFVVHQVKHWRKSIEELCFTSVRSSMNENTVGLILWTKD